MDCKEVQNLLAPLVIGDLEPDSSRYCEVKDHLRHCRACSQEYEAVGQGISFIKSHKGEFAEAISSVEGNEIAMHQELEQSWKSIEIKFDRIEAQEREKKQQRFHTVLYSISAAAACILICVSMWSIYIKTTPIEQQTGNIAARPLQIELISENGTESILEGTVVRTTDNELKSLVISQKHRIVMNASTALAIDHYITNGNLGCRVNLRSGEILANVEHDNRPFIVETEHGKAVITGTTFDIKATGIGTTLVVDEGNVRFESNKAFVKVSAGQISKIIGQLIPSKPISCNTTKLTAWARGYEIKEEPTKIQANAGDNDLTELSTTVSGHIDLQAIDYQQWLEDNREWFKKEFPWIFELKEALYDNWVQADYPELLLKSGDIWQFAYPETSANRIPVFYPNSLIKLSTQYGRDEQWLLENVQSARSAVGRRNTNKDRYTSLEAFEKWLNCLKKSPRSAEDLDPGTLLYSLHAATYLANTRTLLWFEIKEGRLELKPQTRDSVLDLLQGQVNAAAELTSLITRLLGASQGRPCEELNPLCDMTVENITILMDLEKSLKEYEIHRQ